MKSLFLVCFSFGALLLSVSCGDGKKYHDQAASKEIPSDRKLASIIEFQNSLNEEFSDPEVSPLPDRYRKDFKGLEFFKPDTLYSVLATFVRTPDAIPFMMPTNTDRLSEEVVYGIVTFTLNGKKYQLEVYQNEELKSEEDYEDYLFLPFTDETNGELTYEGGRYIDLTIPEEDTLVIDFNKAYNPYCAYNKKYSCPLVPSQNHIGTRILAGVKAFK
ncbi:MAG: DUF1684 domain-containing protein [Flavobacteriaceae bacterium]|nr:DUF1684 domain-containing protein [Muriicola sp.]NNC61876.1 DUF1684 domain-containing protein [Eudoraea sp.]NNK21658.1 DUF1684 domain-containing protein [Flavobacteriaceae bacterium]MBT8290132.1 DUF1684 domain-containing protein [Muriicola sp.]NNK35326.1 DUF1684 domain-containing protein [Eudoraea sp.]